MVKTRVCIVTGTRAEFGLLFWLMKELKEADDFELQTVVTGMHLSPEFGLTWRAIEGAGFEISKRVEMLLSSDTPVGIGKSVGLGIMGMVEAYTELKPNLLVLIGDRFEMMAAALAGTVARIPIAHLHGGETTEGAFDEAFRHSITKMSHLHFTTTEDYRRRAIQLGEQPDRVFNVGAPGLDHLDRLTLLDRTGFEEAIQFKLHPRNLLVTFHPVTLENNTSREQFAALLSALNELTDTGLIFTKANADTDGRIINEMIEQFVGTRRDRAVSFDSLGQLRYLSALQFMDAVVGNSSSGLIEAPSFQIGTVNIGDRQKGRIRGESVIDCEPDVESIREGIAQLYSDQFQTNLRITKNPYGSGGVAEKVVDILRSTEWADILKKPFFDIR